MKASKLFTFVVSSVLACTSAGLKASPPSGSTWNLTFSDEFNNQSTYDHTKWNPDLIWGGHYGGGIEAEWFVDSTQNIDLSSGTSVKLTAIANNPVYNGVTRPYSSGCLSSFNYFNQAFGYWEIRAKVPSGQGVWPAFWCLEGAKEGASYIWPPEIDIMEYIGAPSPTVAYQTNHWSSHYPLDGGSASGLGFGDTSTQDLSQGFHTYAVDWEPDVITWYLDGVPGYVTMGHVPYVRAMHVILNLAIGAAGSWPGTPNANTPFPSIFEVDYCHVYNKALTSPWVAADIGSPANAGRTYASSTGLMNVCGSGTGIAGTSDQFHYAYMPLSGDGTVVARVRNEAGTNSINVTPNAGTLAGLMIRETLNANSSYALMALEPVISGTAGGNVFSTRSSSGGTAAKTVVGNHQGVPSWLKLVRAGSTFTGYSSPDGVTWTQNGTATIGMASSVYVGLAVTGNVAANRATAQFDNIVLPTSGPILSVSGGTGIGITGAWTQSTSAPGYYGSYYLQDGDTGGAGGTKSVKFMPNLLTAGNYKVSAWWTSGTNRASNAPATITTGTGSVYLSLNQQANGSQWVPLGTYFFNSGTGGNVTISDNGANGYVIANAVQFTPAVDIPMGVSDSSGITLTGSWTESTSAPFIYGDYYIQDGNTGGAGGTKSVKFTPSIPVAGSYKVYMWWTDGTNRASNVPVTVVSSSGSTPLTINEQSNGEHWVLLGTYSFNAGTGGSVTVSDNGANGYVIANGMRFIQQ